MMMAENGFELFLKRSHLDFGHHKLPASLCPEAYLS
jgi:hypothetical protein